MLPQTQAKEVPLREKIMRALPRTQITMNTSVGDLIEVNQMLVQYFMQKEFAAPKQSEMAIQTEVQEPVQESPEPSESSEKENEHKG